MVQNKLIKLSPQIQNFQLLAKLTAKNIIENKLKSQITAAVAQKKEDDNLTTQEILKQLLQWRDCQWMYNVPTSKLVKH